MIKDSKIRPKKFTENETAKCLEFIRCKGWDKKLIDDNF